MTMEPRGRNSGLRDVKAVSVEKWLRTLPLARATKAKIRNIMSVLFNHAIRYEFLLPAHLFDSAESKWRGWEGGAGTAAPRKREDHARCVRTGGDTR